MAKRRASPCGAINARRISLSAQFFERFCSMAGTGYGDSLSQLARDGKWDQVIATCVDPGNFTDPRDFGLAYCMSEMMSKADFLDLGIDRAAVALSKFVDAEEICLETNRRLRASFGTSSTGVSMASYLFTAAKKIEALLGPFEWDEAETGFSWGPGASTRLPRSKSDPAFKYSGKPEVSPNCALLAYTSIRRIPLWWSLLTGSGAEITDVLSVVPGNKVITVPKNAKTDRVIAIEPCMNMFLQQGIGKMIRRRLRRAGQDLNDQTRNQQLAYTASLSEELATVDLSMASDTISYELVRQLLPPDWFAALEQCRSPVGVLPSGESVTYQKFSSMGNGYTFELESLIFWALCQSVLSLAGEKGIVSVYGDDIVFPSAYVPQLKEVFSFCGFTVNDKKTWVGGPFRESCGKHYFRGVDVTPFYIREDVQSIPRYYWLANSLCRWLFVRDGFLDSGYIPIWKEIVNAVPSRYRYWIPEGIGDGGFVAPFDRATPAKAPRGFSGWIVKVMVDVTSSAPPETVGSAVAGLHAVERDRHVVSKLADLSYRNALDLQRAALELRKAELRDQGMQISRRFRDRRVRPSKTVVLQWAELGPWV